MGAKLVGASALFCFRVGGAVGPRPSENLLVGVTAAAAAEVVWLDRNVDAGIGVDDFASGVESVGLLVVVCLTADLPPEVIFALTNGLLLVAVGFTVT